MPAKKQSARCTTVKRKAASAGKKPTKAALKKAGCPVPKKKAAKSAPKSRKSRQLIPVRQDQIINARDFFRRQGMREGIDFEYSEFKA